MIVVRNAFKLKFGKAGEATTLWKEGLAIAQKAGYMKGATRLLTDAVGPFYTLILETTHASLGDYETNAKGLMANQEWKTWYAKVIGICEGGHREIWNVVE